MYTEVFNCVLDTYESFWKHESIGRPILNISACEDYSWHKAPRDVRQQWLDEAFICEQARERTAHTRYLAEGTPNLFANLGPGMLAACIGGTFTLAPSTVWFDQAPIISDWNAKPAIRFDENSTLWQHLERIQKRALKDGTYPVSITDLGGIMDVVASLRGTEALLYDLYDDPDEVKALSSLVTTLWLEAFDRQVALCGSTGLPYTSWMDFPSRIPWFPIQCDFCAMISPKQFEEFVLGDLVRQTEHIPRTIYHLDGPGEIPHIDMLLDIPNLNGIQWVPGSGKAAITDPCWFDLYRKIQDKKKNLVLLGTVAEYTMPAIERLVKTLDPTGLYLSGSFGSFDAAERAVEDISRWCGL